MSPGLRVAGLTPLTTIDFPGRLAAVAFLQGCPWRCSYCHNPGLMDATAAPAMTWADVRAFLKRRQGLLDGLVFSGGEPTLHAALPDAVREVRELGFETGLHTAGMYPGRLAGLLPLVDWVGLDVKAPLEEHDSLTGVPGSGLKARASLAEVLRSGVKYECRTTWHVRLFGLDRLLALAQELAGLGVTHWAVQGCRVQGRPQGAPPPAQLARMRAMFTGFCFR